MFTYYMERLSYLCQEGYVSTIMQKYSTNFHKILGGKVAQGPQKKAL